MNKKNKRFALLKHEGVKIKDVLQYSLMERVAAEGWREAGSAFVGCVTRLLERLLDYRAVMQGAEHRDKRMTCTVNLLNFYKNEIDRKEMYLRYVYRLHDLHIATDNFIEAGCTLLLYAETLSWESEQVGTDPEHPDTLEWKRKEALYHQVLQYFDRGKCWEKGLPLLRELAWHYESRLCDYARLAHVLRTHATFLDAILQQLRPEPEYFRVGFYGMGCPLFVRNKQFVYRGHDYERIGAFTQRLQTEYPTAHVLMRNTPPDESIVCAEGQYIQICNVKAVASRRQWPSGAPEQLKRFYATNDVRTFLCDRPVHKPPIDKDNEFKSLWIERTTLVTESSLPGILRWTEVTSRSVEEIPPVEFACETMESVERELVSLINQYTAEPQRNINPFSMRLQGIIDANVQGGISKYEQAFLSAEFAGSGPHEASAAGRLRRLVAAQLAVLEAGLALHGRLAPPGVQPLHKRLVERFSQLRQNLGPGLARARRQLSESIVNSPLPPVPVEKRTHSLQNNDINHYDDGYLYNRPIYSTEEQVTAPPSSNGNTSTVECSVEDGCPATDPIPPLPTRPRSGDPRSPTKSFADKQRDSVESDNMDSLRRQSRASWSELSRSDAPPLPPRTHGSDKRSSLENPHVPRRAQKYSAVDISIEDAHSPCHDGIELRDSGISTTSGATGDNSTNNYTNAYEDCQLRRETANFHLDTLKFDEIVTMMSDSLNSTKTAGTPPPIPPKGLSHLSSFDSGTVHTANGPESSC